MLCRSVSALLFSFLILLSVAPGSAARPTIQLVVPTFDYPDASYHTTIADAVANNGNVVGTVDEASTGRRLIFERFVDGSFNTPVGVPGASNTTAYGVNNFNLICGYFRAADFTTHGFFYDGQTFTQYDAPGEGSGTILTGLNDAGDFCGYATSLVYVAFVSINGTLSDIVIPGVTEVYPQAVNNRGQVAGYYRDPETHRFQGFFRDTNGTLTFPLNQPQASLTQIFGLNDSGLMAGAWTGRDGLSTHGFVLRLPRRYLSFEYPSSEFGPHLSGINNSGLLTGFYFLESDLNLHSFIAQLIK